MTKELIFPNGIELISGWQSGAAGAKERMRELFDQAIEGVGDEFDHEGVEFVQLDVLRPSETESLWDCVVAFGLFSPRVLSSSQVVWSENTKIIISNIIKITKKEGMIVASTREEDNQVFENILQSIDIKLSFKKNTDYARHTIYDKHQYHRMGLSKGGNLVEEYRAYLSKEIKRTNFYIIKQY